MMSRIDENHIIRRIYSSDGFWKQMIELQAQNEEIQKLLSDNNYKILNMN